MPYEQMLLAADPVKVEFDRLLDQLLRELTAIGVHATHKTNLKSEERGKKKVAVDYGGDGSKLIDMVRGASDDNARADVNAEEASKLCLGLGAWSLGPWSMGLGYWDLENKGWKARLRKPVMTFL